MKISFEIKRESKSHKVSPSSDAKTKKRKGWRNPKIILMAFYFGLLASLIISMGTASNDLTSAYVHDQAGFSIRPPEEWLVKEAEKEGTIVSFSDTDKDEAGKISVSSTKTDLDLASFVNGLKEELPKSYPNYKALADFAVTLKGQPAHIIDAEVVVDNVWKHGRLMVMVKNKQAYIVSASTNLGYWDTFSSSTINASLKSFALSK